MKADAACLNLDSLGVREILNALADAAYVTDVNRRIIFWSDAAQRITGWLSRAVEGRSCYDNLLQHVDKDGHALCGEEHCPLHRAITTNGRSEEPLLVFARHKEGHRVPVEVTVAPIQDQTGAVIGGIEVFRDLTQVMEDLRRAQVIQTHALQSRLPEDPRLEIEVVYTPEEIVGGDFYRAEKLDTDHYAVMVADVMGHGVAAALYTMQLRALWEDCRPAVMDPAAFFDTMNQRLHALARADGYFATAFVVVLNAATGALRYARAGHPPALWFRRCGQTTLLDRKSPALGLLDSARYCDGKIQMASGDSVLLYTDGAAEIADAEDQELGEDGLRALLERENFGAVPVPLTQIEQRLLEHSSRIRLSDDLTLVRVTWRGTPPDRGTGAER